MAKVNRNYSMEVDLKGGGSLTIQPPFTLEFDVNRRNFGSTYTASFRVFNLSQNNRNKLRKNNPFNPTDVRNVKVRAGYGTNLSLIFAGNMQKAWSIREGSSFITTIECYGTVAAFAGGQTNVTFPEGTPQKSILQYLIQSMPGIQLGKIGDFPGVTTRATTYSGATKDILNELTNGAFYVDNGIAHVLNDTEAILGPISLINSDSGLLNTPILQETQLTFEMIFEPRLIVGQVVELQSTTEKFLNGKYIVVSLQHKGMISEAVCGEAVTSVELLAPKSVTLVS